MFENLPGANAATVKPAVQKSIGDSLRDNAQEQKAAEDRRENTTVWEGIGAAQVKGGIGLIDRFVQDLGYEPTPDYVIPKEATKRWDNLGITPEQRELFGRAVSEEHLQFLEGVAFQNQMADETLSQFGMAANIGLSLTDPVMAGVGAATGGLGYSATAGRVANGVRAGLAAAAVNTAGEAAIAQYNPEIHLEDLAMTAATSFAFAGALGARKGEVLVKKADDHVDPSKVQRVADAPMDDTLSAARVKGGYGDEVDPTPGLLPIRKESSIEAQRMDEAYANAHIMPAFASYRRDLAARLGKSNSALVRDIGRKVFRDGVGFTDRNIAVEEGTTEYAKRWLGRLEADYRSGVNAAWAGFAESKGKNMATRQIAFSMKRDFYDEVGRAVRGDANVSEHAKQAAVAVQGTMARAAEMAKEAGLEGFDNITSSKNYLPRYFSSKGFQRLFAEHGLEEDDVVEQLIKPAMRKRWQDQLPPAEEAQFPDMVDNYRGTSDSVRAAREKADGLQEAKGARQDAVKAAEARIEEVKDVPGAKGDRMRKAAANRHADEIRKLQRHEDRFKKAQGKLKTATEKEASSGFAEKEAKRLMEPDVLDEDLLDAVSRAYLKRAQANFEGDSTQLFVRPLDKDSVEEIADLLRSAGVDDVKSASILGKLSKTAGEANTLDRVKARIDMDENFSTTMKNASGEDIEVKMSDLFDNDIEDVMGRYLREVTGWSAMSDRMGVRNKSELSRLRDQLRKEATKNGDDVKDLDRIMDIGINTTFGKSTEVNPGSKASGYARLLRQYNFSRVMNQVGWSLFAELGPVAAHAGVRNVLASAAHIGDLLQRGADGKLANAEARMLEELFAPGTDWMRNPPLLRLEDGAATAPVLGNSKLGRGIENSINGAAYATGVMSGMAPMNTVLQRVAGRATMLKLLNQAKKGALSTAETARLRNWGMTEKAQAELFGVLKKAKKIEDIDVNSLSFKNREELSAFMYRVTRHQVLESDVSDSMEFMHSASGKIVSQFRTFMQASYSRHFLNTLHHYDDWRNFVMIGMSTTIAGVGWAARTYINTAHDPEQRKKQLTVENFMKNSFAQSSYSSYGPMLTDMVWSDVLHNDPIFANNRSTGLSNGIMGIPTLDLVSKVYGSSGMIGSALRDDEHITQKQARDFWKTWSFNNMTGVRNLADMAIKQLPEEQLPREKKESEATPLLDF